MRHLLSFSAALALGSFALASCGDEPAQPNTGAEPGPTTLELASASNGWITRANLPRNRTYLTVATVKNAAVFRLRHRWAQGRTPGQPDRVVTSYPVFTRAELQQPVRKVG